MHSGGMLALLVGGALVCPGWAFGLEGPQPAPGSRVRVELAGGGRTLTGRLLELSSDSMTISMDGGSHTVPRGQIRLVEVSGGRPSRWRRAAVGAGIGAASAIPAAAFTGEWHVTAPLALVGGVIGLSLPNHERWNAVEIRGVEMRASPLTNMGAGIAVSLSS